MINLLVRIDRWINDRLLKGRWETISGRCWRRSLKGCRVCSWLCRLLSQVDANHCRDAYVADRFVNPNLPD